MVLRVDSLIKDFRKGFFRKKTRVLKNISFEVNQGEIFGVIGPNGAGKTVTFKSVMGFISPTSGNIKIFGQDNSKYLLKEKLGYLPENPYFYEYLTGFELLNYMGSLHGIHGKHLLDRINYLLDRVNLTKSAGVQLRKYSKGMLQRIGIAQAIINDPDFVIFDEPMSGLDPLGRREVRDLILELKNNGKTVILSSHILSDLEALCDRVCFIFHGEVVKQGNLADLLSEIESGYEAIIRKNSKVTQQLFGNNVVIEQRGEFIALIFDEQHKNNILQSIHSNQIDLVSFHPIRKSLENIFNIHSVIDKQN
ncbi:MAG TPA: ABC transporter ATP-binding protein [Thermodesulfobacteriota bacterium]|nr:ABC transporter ATP-binding protein [Thermodesulfobacteriota bacterium]